MFASIQLASITYCMKKTPLWLFLGIALWMLIDGVQAFFTELDPDEAYYWMYSRRLAWGYFDHPPAVALMIRAGYSLFSNELGVRLMTILLHGGAVYLIWLLAGRPTGKKEGLSLFLLLAAMPMFQLYGFITTPDPPLLFFTALFFWAYYLFLNKKHWGFTVFLGLSMVLMLYSKYHGVLVILCVLFSNLRLLKNPRFYLASFLGAALFVPHLWWQVEQDFPSLKYHLVGRNDPYALKHTLSYLVNQLVNFSPLLFPFWLLALRARPRKNPLYRAMGFTVWGFWGFFLLATAKGHAEPQWTAVLTIPLAVLGLYYLKKNPHRQKLVHILCLISIGLLLGGRVLLMTDLGARALPEFHKKEWIEVLRERAGDRPVLFVDNYRDPSTYSFYTGDFSTAINNPVSYRRNQFDIWSYEERYHRKDVLLFQLPEAVYCRHAVPFQEFGKNRKTCEADNIQIVHKVQLEWPEQSGLFRSGASIELPVRVQNPYGYDIFLNDKDWPVNPILYIIQAEKSWECRADLNLDRLPADSRQEALLSGDLPELSPGRYQLALMLEGNGMIYSVNSGLYDFKIK